MPSIRSGIVMALGVSLTCSIASRAAAPPQPVHESGYIAISDGTRLRYAVDRPAGPGPFPVAMNYDGYCAGTGTLACNDPQLAKRLLSAGYAVVGVSVRGTGCSSGAFDFRAREASTDGAAAVTWAARQSWSNGRVGLFGDSFPGLTQPGIAALRPKGLAAIAPFQIVDDVYRDVGYPGGIFNAEFGAFWGLANQPASDATNPLLAAQEGDGECAANYAGSRPGSTARNIFLNGAQHAWDDGYWGAKQVGGAAHKINVPTLGCLTWQDDEVGSRPGWTIFPRVKPEKLWMVAGNGYHGMCDRDDRDRMNAQVVRFFDRFVRGIRNGWERTPRVQIWHESHRRLGYNTPSWVTTHAKWPPATVTHALTLAANGVLADPAVTGSAGGASYRAPWPSAGTEQGILLGQGNRLWQRPVPPGGAAAWTTPRLTRDVEVLGPASADLWLASSGTDTDLQATITEVRPDGQETYIARGWLRASHAELDAAQSRPTRPFHTHRERTARPLVPGVPRLLRLEVFPFNHVFRAGSSIRVIFDTPSQTGGWNFSTQPTPVTNTVLYGGKHRSQLVFGVMPHGRAQRPLPPCDTLLNQPCRPNAYPVPPGRMAWPAG